LQPCYPGCAWFKKLYLQLLYTTVSTRLRIRKSASAFLTGVVDYITSEVLDLSGHACHALKKKRITPRQIMFAIRGDEVGNQAALVLLNLCLKLFMIPF